MLQSHHLVVRLPPLQARPPHRQVRPPPRQVRPPPRQVRPPPNETTAPPSETTAPPSETTALPSETTAPTSETTAPPSATTAPPSATALPSATTAPILDCQALLDAGHTTDGVYTINPSQYPDGLDVYCDMTTDSKGWIVSSLVHLITMIKQNNINYKRLQFN